MVRQSFILHGGICPWNTDFLPIEKGSHLIIWQKCN